MPQHETEVAIELRQLRYNTITSPTATADGTWQHTGYDFGAENTAKGGGEYIWPSAALGDSLQGLFLSHRKVDATTGAVTMTRPLCKYPAHPRYKGTGDMNDAADFECSTL